MASAISVRTDDGRRTMLACPNCMYFATPGRTCPVCGEGIDYEVEGDEEADALAASSAEPDAACGQGEETE